MTEIDERKKAISITLDVTLLDKIDQYAELNKLSRSATISLLVSRALRFREAVIPQPSVQMALSERDQEAFRMEIADYMIMRQKVLDRLKRQGRMGVGEKELRKLIFQEYKTQKRKL